MSAALSPFVDAKANLREPSWFGGRVRPCRYCILIKKAVARRGRGLGIHVSILFALIGLLSARAVAAVHPVPLDKNTDPRSVWSATTTKTKRKSVHSAMAGRLPELP